VDATCVRNPRKWVYKDIAHKFPNQKRKRKKTKVVVFKLLYNLKIDIVWFAVSNKRDIVWFVGCGGVLNELFGNLQVRRSSYYSSFTLRCNWKIQSAGISQAVALVSLQELSLSYYRRVCYVHGILYRGYYTVARRYEFYVRVARTISHSFASLTREILFLPREHKIHIFEPTCNVLFIIWRLNIEYFRFYCVSK